MVKALGALQARGAGTRRSWYDWQERPETVSALTLLAVIRVIGRAGITELLFDGLTPPSEQDASVDEMAARVNRLEDQLAGFTEVTTRLQETARIQGDLLDRIADALRPALCRGSLPGTPFAPAAISKPPPPFHQRRRGLACLARCQ